LKPRSIEIQPSAVYFLWRGLVVPDSRYLPGLCAGFVGAIAGAA